jgi:hypothetical protein
MMGGLLGNIGTLAFLNPWVMAGLIFLPLLWFLLRITPPAPRLVVFPAARLLAGLEPEEHTSSKTPWWILLLRLLILALIITAMARPVINPATELPGHGPVRLVIDNSWAGAQTWNLQTEKTHDIIRRAGREHREIFVITTAPKPGQDSIFTAGPLSQGQAASIIKGLSPHPWPANYNALLQHLEDHPPEQGIHSFWLSHGLEEKNAFPLIKTLQNQGGLTHVTPEKSALPLLLRPGKNVATDLEVRISAPDSIPAGTPVRIQAMNDKGRVLDVRNETLAPDNIPLTVTFDIPVSLRNQIAQIRLSNRKGAGAVLLMDEQFKRRSVGITAPQGEAETAPLIKASYYLNKALEPYADIQSGDLPSLLEQKPSVIIMPDIGGLGPEQLNALEKWVKDGGVLVRFAGPNMTQSEVFLTPVPLRLGDRALDGSLSWDDPAKLAPFPENSPFFDLAIPEDITVKRQILAEPGIGLDEKTWAALEDGTPLITADNLEKGMLVFFHTTATTEWSNLSLSGLYVQILRRIVNLAGNTTANSKPATMLHPVLVLNGHGATEQPKSYVLPIPHSAFDTLIPGPSHPPGIYGHSGYQKSLNLGERLPPLKTFDAMPVGVQQLVYGKTSEKDLMPLLLGAAFFLFLFDWLLMMALQLSFRHIHLPRPQIKTLSALLLAIALAVAFSAPPAKAQNKVSNSADNSLVMQEMAKRAGELHLAFVKTGSATIDNTARQGLENLSQVLTRRTSVEPAGVIALDPARDELAFFPLIYWPIAPGLPPLSDAALRNIQNYLDHGGTILFDTRDQRSVPRTAIGPASGGNSETLRRMIGSLNVPPLAPMRDDHVLSKSFYLLRSFPGKYDSGIIWVESQSENGRDGVSSVIIGGHDWAGEWASPVGGRRHELAMRFGVNLIMYALTGNYKADQVHLPHILERLGQ